MDEKSDHKVVIVPKPAKQAKQARVKAHNPPSPYALFLREVRAQLSDEKVVFKDFTRMCSQMWRKMTAEEKDKYYRMGREVRDALKSYGLCAKRRTLKDPKTRKKTNYWNFAEVMRPLVIEEYRLSDRMPRMTDVNKEVGRRWQRLTVEEKESYKTTDQSVNTLTVTEVVFKEEK